MAINLKDLPILRASQVSDLQKNHVIFFPPFFKEWKKISFNDFQKIVRIETRDADGNPVKGNSK